MSRPMTSYFVLLSLLLLAHNAYIVASLEGHIECESIKEVFPSGHWKSKYGLYRTNTGFMYNEIFQANFTSRSGSGTQKSVEGIFLIESGDILPMRRFDADLMFTFAHGDTVVFHVIDPKTGDYSRTQLGFHTNQYFIPIPHGFRYAIDIERHEKDDYVLLGVTYFVYPNTALELIWADKNKLLNSFPQHADVINKYTN